MARILCVTSGLTALLYSTIALARRLEAAGHEVTCASAAAAAEVVHDHDVRFVAVDSGGLDRFLNGDASRSLGDRLRHIGARRAAAARATGASAFKALIGEHRPDLILIDAEMHPQIMAASATGVPIALLVSFVYIWRRPGLPPPHHLVRPGVGWKGSRAGMWALWLNLRLRKRWLAWSQWVRHLGCDRLSVLRRLAHDLRFDLRRGTDAGQWLIPFTYRDLPALCTHAIEFEFPHAPRAGVQYLGPQVLEPRIERRVSAADRAQLAACIARRRTAGQRRRLIYAGFGSFFSAGPDLVRRLIEAVAARPDWELVLSLGGRPAPLDTGAMPRNVLALSWAPQMEVLRESDVAVIHGGVGTVDECVVCGVPMLVYCGFETDMGGTTARVWHHGLGMVGNRDDSPARIRDRIELVLDDPGLRERVARLGAAYARYADAGVAERIVDQLLAGSAASSGRGPAPEGRAT